MLVLSNMLSKMKNWERIQILLHQHVCFSFKVVLSVGAILKMQMVIEVPRRNIVNGYMLR